MKILFLSYWGIDEGLSSATVIPHLRILSELNSVDQIIFCSIERKKTDIKPLTLPKVEHVPLLSRGSSVFLLDKLSDFIKFPKIVTKLCAQFEIDFMICRSPMAGALGYLVWRKTKLAYIVESFEPHALSMRESGVWAWYDPRFWIQHFFETRQKKTARKILPVSWHYFNRLKQEGINESRLYTMPCCVQTEKFEFNSNARIRKRESLGFKQQEIVGIYVGKFGGIYHDTIAFHLFKKSFDFFGSRFRLIILSGDDHDKILQRLKENGISVSNVVLDSVSHSEVPDFLSAADFAFSTIKPVQTRIYCSPIKNGEYWANGLPIMTEMGIGDDSDIIVREGGGVILNIDNPKTAFEAMQSLLKIGREKLGESIVSLAFKYRRMELVEDAYKNIVKNTQRLNF
ncbi:MAG: hypothetical protein R2820_08865 [Cyclobacteriaceae bacterium]|nr:hypothetical protein [Cyclobacteriaceae bacterium]